MPKTVSILWSQVEEKDREDIERLHHEAVKETLEYIEENVASSRKGRGGTEQIAVKLVAAAFQHSTSRAGDPQLHAHTLLINLGLCEDEKYRMLDGRPLLNQKMFLGAYYRAKLAKRLRDELGLTIIADGTSFRVKGISKRVVDANSKRRNEIKEDMRKEGTVGAAAAAASALKTRKKKDPLKRRDELFRDWQEHNARLGFTQYKAERLIRRDRRPRLKRTKHPQKLLRDALAYLTRQQAHFSEDEFLVHVMQLLPEYDIDSDMVIPQAKSFLRTHRHIVELSKGTSEPRYTTKEILAEEAPSQPDSDRLFSRLF